MSWPVVAFAEAAKIARVGVAPEDIIAGTTYVGLENIDSLGDFVGVSGVDAGELGSTKFRFGKDQVLFGKLRPYLKKTARPGFDGVCSTDILPLSPAKHVDRNYLFHVLRRQSFVDEVTSLCAGANLPRISPSVLGAMRIPLPPLPEQRRIAAILDKADALRAKRREAIAKLDQLLQSVFLEMFGDPKSNPYGFPVRELSEFYISPNEGTRCGPFGSALKKSDITESGIPLWNMDNILSSGQMQLPFRAWVSKEKAQELDSYRVADGDILISRAGTVGKMCVARTLWETSFITTNLIRLRLGHQLIPEYFVALMTYCKGRVGRLRTGPDGAFTHMSTGMLDKLSFPYPAISQQRSWVARSAAIQGHKAKLSEQLERMTRQFESISARAFSGGRLI